MKLQKLLSYTRKAIDDYGMIEKNDKIAIGISGGKDSLALLYSLNALQKFYKVPFSIIGIYVDLGLDSNASVNISKLCKHLDIEFYIIKTEISKIVFNERNEKNPCSLCSKLRKGALNQLAVEKKCNKIAYGHHIDDFIETALLSLFFEGKFYCFPPVTHLEKTQLTLIRPLMYVPEKDIIGFRNKYNLPVISKICPNDGYSKREYIKQLIQKENKNYPVIKKNIFSAIQLGKFEDWPNKSRSDTYEKSNLS